MFHSIELNPLNNYNNLLYLRRIQQVNQVLYMPLQNLYTINNIAYNSMYPIFYFSFKKELANRRISKLFIEIFQLKKLEAMTLDLI